MARHWSEWPEPVLTGLRRGVVIPAHPLALDGARLDAFIGQQLEELHQVADRRFGGDQLLQLGAVQDRLRALSVIGFHEEVH